MAFSSKFSEFFSDATSSEVSAWAVIANYRKLGGISDRNFWRLEGGDQGTWLDSGEGRLLGCRRLSFCCILTWRKESELALWSVLIRT